VRALKALVMDLTDAVSALTPVLAAATERVSAPPTLFSALGAAGFEAEGFTGLGELGFGSVSATMPPVTYCAIPPYGTKSFVCGMTYSVLHLG
jgi:hypothetical protein